MCGVKGHCGRPKGHVGAPKGTVPFGKGQARTLMGSCTRIRLLPEAATYCTDHLPTSLEIAHPQIGQNASGAVDGFVYHLGLFSGRRGLMSCEDKPKQVRLRLTSTHSTNFKCLLFV